MCVCVGVFKINQSKQRLTCFVWIHNIPVTMKYVQNPDPCTMIAHYISAAQNWVGVLNVIVSWEWKFTPLNCKTDNKCH